MKTGNNAVRYWLSALTVAIMMAKTVNCAWANVLGGMLSRSCMYGFGITGIQSQYAEDQGDRLWEFQCSKIGLLTGQDFCIWTYDFENEFGKKLNYNCKENQYIAGVYSDYNATSHDRIWRIECCSSPGIRVSNCQQRDWEHRYGKSFNLQLSPKQVFQGLVSVYRAEQKDRRWQFTVCDIEKDQDMENQSP